MLTIRHLTKRFGQRTVLDDIGLDVAAGEYIAIMGESGVGKSTLLNLLAGLDTADSGRVELDGVDLGSLDDDARTGLRRRRMGFVFQAFHLLPYLTVAENGALPLALAGVTAPERNRRIDGLLATLGLGGRRDDYPRMLSGGEMQRVAVARALVHQPQLVLADKPTGNLDADNARTVLRLLKTELARTGAAGILVTHSPLAAKSADRVYMLSSRGLHLTDRLPA